MSYFYPKLFCYSGIQFILPEANEEKPPVVSYAFGSNWHIYHSLTHTATSLPQMVLNALDLLCVFAVWQKWDVLSKNQRTSKQFKARGKEEEAKQRCHSVIRISWTQNTHHFEFMLRTLIEMLAV